MRSQTQATYRERMLRVLVHIQQNLDETLSLDDLARVAHFSPHHFHRIFRGMVGETVAEHLRRLRLERAAQRLRNADDSVTRLAFAAGYETHEAFTRAFHARFGASPSEYRRRHRSRFQGGEGSESPSDPRDPSEPHDFNRRGVTMMDITVEKINPMRVAFMRHTGPYEACGETWGRFCEWAGPRGHLHPGATILGASHDDPEVTPPDKIRYDCCVTVGDEVKPEGDVGVQTLGGGEYAVAIHCGPYERLAETYAEICGQWAPSTGRELSSAPCLELYLNDPSATPPEDLRTKVCVPLEER